MTKQILLTRVAATLTTLAECDGGSPESMLYLAFGSDIEEWQVLRNILLQAKLVTIKANYVQLTADGRKKAEEINAALAKVKR
jgi:hypothetical protein